MLVCGAGGAPGPGVALESMKIKLKSATIRRAPPKRTGTMGKARIPAFGSEAAIIEKPLFGEGMSLNVTRQATFHECFTAYECSRSHDCSLRFIRGLALREP